MIRRYDLEKDWARIREDIIWENADKHILFYYSKLSCGFKICTKAFASICQRNGKPLQIRWQKHCPMPLIGYSPIFVKVKTRQRIILNMEETHYRVVIIDDSAVSVEQLMLELRRFAQFEVAGVAKNGVNGKKLIKQYRPQLLFLDIELPETTGVQMLDEMTGWVDWRMEIVFFTCHSKYMIDAVRNPVFDFLQKPVDGKELENILNRFEQKQEQMKKENYLSNPAHSEGFTRKNALMIYTYSGDLLLLNIQQIGFFKYSSPERRWILFLADGRQIKMKVGVSAKQMLATSPLLFQINPAVIINVTYLELIRGTLCQFYPPFDTVNDLTISSERKKELQDFFACI